MDRVDYQTEPSRYKHWKLKFDGPVATLLADFDENAGLRPGYKLKLNSYDLGVDIELNDAVNRIRFERPEVRVVVITSARERVFCSGANIFMLGLSSHAWKVNFCKFTNETRNGLEDSSKHDGLKFLAAVNGSCAGGGYELALACDEIILIDDRSSAVSLPEVPLLGVLPGTGGLTRLTDKRHVRHDLADVFCTTSEGVRGEKAVAWRLVDAIAKPAQFQAKVQERALALAASSDRPQSAKGVALTPIERTIEADALSYAHVNGDDRSRRARRDFRDQRPERRSAAGHRGDRGARRELVSARARPRARGRDPVDAHQRARHRRVADEDRRRASKRFSQWTRRSTRSESIGWCAKRSAICAAPSAGSTSLRAACSRSSTRAPASPARSSKSRSLATGSIISPAAKRMRPGSRSAQRTSATTRWRAARAASGGASTTRRPALEPLKASIGKPLDADAAFALGLATSIPDDIDWADEIRIAVEERASMSPDALTAMEANLRFDGPETLATRVFGRLTAWQNWIFQRPNAVGDKGALKVYGKGEKAAFDWNRV